MGSSNSSPRKDAGTEAAATGHLPREARKPYILSLVVVALSASFGNILVKYGLERMQLPPVGSLPDIPFFVVKVASNFWLDFGVFLLVVQFGALINAFRYGPLSLTVPLRGASIYVGTDLLAQFVLGEEVSLVRWASILLIIIGITLIGISGGKG